MNKFKVAGTTFRPLPEGKSIQITSEFMDGVPCAAVRAILKPEPTNAYDPEAVMVFVSLTDGSAFHIGYVPKAEPIKRQIKFPMLADMVIRDYGQVSAYNASFVITRIYGL